MFVRGLIVGLALAAVVIVAGYASDEDWPLWLAVALS